MQFVWVALLAGCTAGYSARAGDALGVKWEQVGEHMEEATSRDEFRKFQARYPQYFGGEDSSRVSYAFVQRERFVFKGPSRCAPGDPRLNHEVITYGACLQGEAEGQCFQTMGEGLPEGDPCVRKRKSSYAK